MTIIDAIKKGLKAAGVNEKYAAKVQKLFKIEKEEDIDTYVALFKDNILPDLEDTSAVEKARKDAIAEYEKNNGLKDGKPIKPVKKTKKTAKSEEDDEDEDEDEDFEGLPASVKVVESSTEANFRVDRICFDCRFNTNNFYKTGVRQNTVCRSEAS